MVNLILVLMIQFLTNWIAEVQKTVAEEQLLNMERQWDWNVLLRKIFSTVLLGLCKEETSVCRDVSETISLIPKRMTLSQGNGPSKVSKVGGVVKLNHKLIVRMIKRLKILVPALYVVKILLLRRVVN